MDDYVVRQLGLILAEFTRVLGMQAENMQREVSGQSMAYADKDFDMQAQQLEFLSRQLDR